MTPLTDALLKEADDNVADGSDQGVADQAWEYIIKFRKLSAKLELALARRDALLREALQVLPARGNLRRRIMQEIEPRELGDSHD